jgi:hypothetical protein
VYGTQSICNPAIQKSLATFEPNHGWSPGLPSQDLNNEMSHTTKSMEVSAIRMHPMFTTIPKILTAEINRHLTDCVTVLHLLSRPSHRHVRLDTPEVHFVS